MGDLPKWKKYEKWSHCNGWPTKVEDESEDSLIVMDDLPKWKIKSEEWKMFSL